MPTFLVAASARGWALLFMLDGGLGDEGIWEGYAIVVSY